MKKKRLTLKSLKNEFYTAHSTLLSRIMFLESKYECDMGHLYKVIKHRHTRPPGLLRRFLNYLRSLTNRGPKQ